MAYLPKLGIIRLRLTGRGQNREEVKVLLEREKLKLEEILGEDIFSEEDTPLEVIVGELLKKKKLTVSTAESCTGGSIAARLTSIAGSSEYFNGSVVAYSNEVKMGPLAALSGLRAAEVRFTNAASRIVNAPVQPVSAVPSARNIRTETSCKKRSSETSETLSFKASKRSFKAFLIRSG